ncbi:Hypothetical protein EIN_468640, partial [Entamoeba invadens IP1]
MNMQSLGNAHTIIRYFELNNRIDQLFSWAFKQDIV